MNKPKKRYLIYDVTSSDDGFCNHQVYSLKDVNEWLGIHYSNAKQNNAIANNEVIQVKSRSYKVYAEVISA